MSLPFQEYERIDLNGFPKKEKEMRFFFYIFVIICYLDDIWLGETVWLLFKCIKCLVF